MPEWLQGLLIPVAGLAIPTVIGFFLPRKKTRGWGVSVGKMLSAFGQKKMGKSAYEKAEGKLQSSINDFIEGVHEGLDADDK
ncbi:hypothetical protein CL634_02820 [bacterium]|nr:hypothetical protein [bacterium]